MQKQFEKWKNPPTCKSKKKYKKNQNKEDRIR